MMASISFQIPISQKMGESLISNENIRKTLDIYEIYVIFYSFKSSGIFMSHHFYHIFSAFYHLIMGISKSEVKIDTSHLVFSIEIIKIILEERLHSNSRLLIEKRINKMLITIEAQFNTIPANKIHFIQAIKLASGIVPFCSTPNLFFGKLLEVFKMHQEFYLADPKRYPIIGLFVQNLLEAYEPKYHLFSGNMSLKLNPSVLCFVTNDAKGILVELVSRLFSSAHPIYEYLSLKIITNKSLLAILFPNEPQRTAIIQKISRSFIENLKKEELLFSEQEPEYLETLLTFCVTHKKSIDFEVFLEFFESKLDEILGLLVQREASSTFPFLYRLASFFTDPTSSETSADNISKTASELKEKLRSFVSEKVTPRMIEDFKKAASLSESNEKIKRHFSHYVADPNLLNTEFILPLFRLLDLKLAKDSLELLLVQLKKTRKSWEAQMVIETLLFFEDCEEPHWDFFDSFLSCFSVFLELDYSENHLQVIRDLDDSQMIKVVDLYLSQFEISGKPPRASDNLSCFSLVVSHLAHHFPFEKIEVFPVFLKPNKPFFWILIENR